MDKHSGLKRMSSNPGPAKVILINPNAKSSDSIENNKIGSAPSLHNKINSDQLPPVPSRGKTTDNLAAPKKDAKRHTTEIESKSGITKAQSMAPGAFKSNNNYILPPVAPRKVATASPPGSGEFTTIARDLKANSNDSLLPPPTAPRKIAVSVNADNSVNKFPPPTAPRTPPATRYMPNTTVVASSPTMPRNITVQPKLGVPPPIAPRGMSDDKPLSPREDNLPPVAPRVPITVTNTGTQTTSDLPPVASRNPAGASAKAAISAPSSVVIRNVPAAAAKKSNASSPSASGEFMVPKVDSGPKLLQGNTPPPVAPRIADDRLSTEIAVAKANEVNDQLTKVGSNPSLAPPLVAPRKVGERPNSKEDPDSKPNLIPPTAAAKKRDSGELVGSPGVPRNHVALASSMPTRSPPFTELRSSTPDAKPTGPPPGVPKAATETLVVLPTSNVPKGPAPTPARVELVEKLPTVAQAPPPKAFVTDDSEPTDGGRILHHSRPKSAPFKVPSIQRKAAESVSSPRGALSPRNLSPTPQPSIPDPIPTIVIDDHKPDLAIHANSAPQIMVQRDEKPPGIAQYTKNVPRPPSPREDDKTEPPKGVTASSFVNKSVPAMPSEELVSETSYPDPVRPPSPYETIEPKPLARYTKAVPLPPDPLEGENEDPSSLAPPKVDKRSSVEVDIDPIMLTLSPRSIQEQADENAIYGSGLDYYLDPENQFMDNFAGDGFIDEAQTEPHDPESSPREQRKSAWVKVTKPKATAPRGDLQTPDLAKPRGTIDPDDFAPRPHGVSIANRNYIINENEPPEEDSGNENDGPPSDAPAAMPLSPREEEKSSSEEENAAAAKAKKDLKKIQKFFTKVIPKKLGINKDKDNKDNANDSSSEEGNKSARVKTVGFDDPSLTPEEREARKKQLEEEERIRKEEKERRKLEKERLKREEKERDEKERGERDKIKAAEKEEKDRLKREEKEREEKEKEGRDKVKLEEKERLRKEKEEREAREAANKPAVATATPTTNFKVDKKAPNITKALPKLSEDDGNRLNHVTIDRPAFKGRRPPTRVMRPIIVPGEGDNEIDGQDAPTPATPMEL